MTEGSAEGRPRRVFVSVDLEGVAGVAVHRQTLRGHADYEDARELMVQEANAVVRGAFGAGAERVVVNDSHGDLCNLLPARLDPRALLQIGEEKRPHEMVMGADEGYDAAILVGYHGRAGTQHAVLDHSFSGDTIAAIRVDGEPWGELELNAATLGWWGVPVVLVTGDDKVCAQAEALLPGVTTVVVKEGLRARCARSISPARARELIEEAARMALSAPRDLAPFKPRGPHLLEMDFHVAAMADAAAVLPGVRRTSGTGVTVDAADVEQLGRYRCVLTTLGESVN